MTSPLLRAIETRYSGYRFRSRLEARWAVFFDALGIEWQYESEGFHLHHGDYLPDFWMPKVRGRQMEVGVWVEIKGVDPTRQEEALCDELAAASRAPVVMLVGLPPMDPGWGSCDGGYQWSPGVRDDGSSYVYRDNCMSLHYCEHCRRGDAAKFEFRNDYYGCPVCGNEKLCTYDNRFVRAAAESALSARFEHGERGSPVRPRFLL